MSKTKIDKSIKKSAKIAKKELKRELKQANRAFDLRENATEKQRKDNAKGEKPSKKNRQRTEDQLLRERIEEIAKRQQVGEKWYDLDNAALIFPASDSVDMSNMFRQGVLLTEPVDPIVLQEAVNLIVPRFPSLTSALKRGLFWHYLEPTQTPLVVEKENTLPCRTMAIDAGSPLIRVGYYGNRIYVEYSHAVTDGNGGITFLNSLLGCYFKLLGHEIKDKTNCLNHLDKPKPEEVSDDYRRYSDDKKRKRAMDKTAYRLAGKRLPNGSMITVTAVMSASKVNAKAKEYLLTVGQLLTACLIKAVQEDRDFYVRSKKKPVIIGVPVNIRKHCDSKTLRNFVALMHVEGEEDRDIKALGESVKRQFAEQDNEEFLKAYVNFNVNASRNALFKILPLPVKNLALKFIMKLFGNRATTCTFSNLGKISAPEEFKDKVLRYDFNLGPQPTVLTSVGAAAYGDCLTLTFARTIEESGVEKRFFRYLTEMGLDVALETERVEE